MAEPEKHNGKYDGKYDGRLEKAMRCMAPPEPDVLAATRALKPVIEDPFPVANGDAAEVVRASTVLATYALTGQQFLYWHARGNITFVQQHSPWEKHLRQRVAHYHDAAAHRSVDVLTACYGKQMFDRLGSGETIRTVEYRCAGGGDATILACFAYAAVLGSNEHLRLLRNVTADTDHGRQIQAYVRDTNPTVQRPTYNVDSGDAPENFAWKAVRFGARCGLEILSEAL